MGIQMSKAKLKIENAITYICNNTDVSTLKDSKLNTQERLTNVILMYASGLDVDDIANLIYPQGGKTSPRSNLWHFVKGHERKIQLNLRRAKRNKEEDLSPWHQARKLSEICKSIAVN